MPYLLHNKEQFVLVDTKSKQGLFFQIYNHRGFLRPIHLQNYTPSSYSALLTKNGSINIVAKNGKRQVVLYTHLNRSSKKTILLEDPENNYNFTDLRLCETNGISYLFYCTTAQNNNSKTLLSQNISDISASPITLVENFTPYSSLKHFVYNNTFYFSYIEQIEDRFYIKAIEFKDLVSTPFILLNSDFPILEFEFIISDGIFHIIYTENAFGRNRLCYINTNTKERIILHTDLAVHTPCIFKYLDCLWVNFLNDTTLYTMLSIDNGSTFSSEVKSSSQNNLHYYNFYSNTSTSLIASTMYASVFNKIRLSVVGLLDSESLHPDLPANNELDLFLEAFKLRHSPLPQPQIKSPPQTPRPPSTPVPPLKPPLVESSLPPVLTQPPTSSESPTTTPDTTPPPHSTKDLKSLAKAFVDDALPVESAPPTPPANSNPADAPPQNTSSVDSAIKDFMNTMNTFDAPPLDK